MALAILFEALIVLLVLAFAAPEFVPVLRDDPPTFTLSPAPAPDVAAEDMAPAEAEAAEPADRVERPAEPVPATPVPTAPPPPIFDFPDHIPLTRREMATADIARPDPPASAPTPAPTPSRPRRAYGPADPGAPAGGAYADTARVAGAGPNGEPLYAARWYREPLDEELRGYLSTASGPGWAMIACRTVVGFRVEDCVLEAESPRGSNIGRSVLAAAWQFRVRPPQLGGRPRFGEWVRIRIDYDLRRISPP